MEDDKPKGIDVRLTVTEESLRQLVTVVEKLNATVENLKVVAPVIEKIAGSMDLLKTVAPYVFGKKKEGP